MPESDQLEHLLAELRRHGLGGLNPDEGQLRALAADAPEGPLQFVNLLAFHPVARYPAGHPLADRGISGADAYARYGAVALDHVTRRGGRLVIYGEVAQVVVGEGRWDQVAVMEYPGAAAFLDMVVDRDYGAALVHRDAGLARTLVLVTRPMLP